MHTGTQSTTTVTIYVQLDSVKIMHNSVRAPLHVCARHPLTAVPLIGLELLHM